MMKKKILIILLVIITGFAFVKTNDNFSDHYFQISKNLDIYFTLMQELDLYYVDEINPEELVKTSIDKMLETLDPYTVFIPESKMEDYKFMTTGQYGGVGALIKKKGDYIMITDPYYGWPAQQAGLISGDIIIKIDGKSIKGKSVSDVSELLKGEPGTEVTLTIKRIGVEKPLEFKIKRKKIKIPSVPYAGILKDSIGYIKLTSFTLGSGDEVKTALTKLKNEHPGLKGVILDLRGNPGGLLIEAINVANIFIDKNKEIVSTKGKVKQWNRTYKTSNSAIDDSIPLVLLVDGGSASASEIVSGSIQDYDRGVLVGQRTFGKGLVQTTRDLSYNTKLKLTTAKYYIPSGRCIQAIDYSHKDKNGKATLVPDSLRKEFNTKNGRKVYDGKGIVPDLVIDLPDFPNYVGALINKDAIFNYASLFYTRKKHIQPPESFSISDSILKDFKHYLDTINFTYECETEKQLDKIEKIAKNEKYYDALKDDIKQIKSKLQEDRKNDFNKHKSIISQILEQEIIGRYYYQKGKIKTFLKYDPETEEAIKILTDTSLYHKFLNPTYTPGTDTLKISHF
jgi:carboxyl-terminal processing protease